MKKMKTALLLLVFIFLPCLGIATLLLLPYNGSATSPNGRLVAEFGAAPSIYGASLVPDHVRQKKMRVKLWVTDKRTGERVKVRERRYNGAFGGDNENPFGLKWSPDSKSFTYQHSIEIAIVEDLYTIDTDPLRFRVRPHQFIDPQFLESLERNGRKPHRVKSPRSE
jgi:hypothetical protein